MLQLVDGGFNDALAERRIQKNDVERDRIVRAQPCERIVLDNGDALCTQGIDTPA